MGKYDDIIHLPHHTSSTHPRMPMENRAAQFSPFAALTGYDAAVKETERVTDQRMELDEYEKMALDEKLRIIQQHLDDSPVITVTYFEPDQLKEGGAYITLTEPILKIDYYKHQLVMESRVSIPINEIIEINADFLDDF